MIAADRTRLTVALREHVAGIAQDLRGQLRAPGAVRERARMLHSDERVGEDFDVWTDLLSRRAAVLWVLKSVYVRVLEDRGLLSPGRILDPEAQHLFGLLAPNLGETAFLRWVYRDLASRKGGLPELFSVQPAEVTVPADELSRALIVFWRHKDPDTGQQWSFAEERFEGELMGDLYQELDPVVKDRFALCQTPDFVREFILDRTLTPAIETFGADQVRLLDPACGSGHFLIDGLKRLVEATGGQHPEWAREKVVTHCLERVVGIDLNDYACALARARLVMTAAELAGVERLGEAARYHPHVYWGDGLEQVERDEVRETEQLDLFDPGRQEPARASLTRPEVRVALKRVLAPKFHAVVANPPYITEKDEARKNYHRERNGREPRYVSAYRQYSLACPFTERCHQVAVDSGYVGLITGNYFTKCQFGKPLIEKVLSVVDLWLVVDTSRVYLPHHGTATVLLFWRNRPPTTGSVHVVMGKRGEAAKPNDPARGRAWLAISKGWHQIGLENEFIGVENVSRHTLSKHPWTLGGGGASSLREWLEAPNRTRLGALAEVGFGALTREDDVYLIGRKPALRLGVPLEQIRSLVEGDSIRNWAIMAQVDAIWPYDKDTKRCVAGQAASAITRALWRWRTRLARRVAYGKTQLEHGLTWFEYSMFFWKRFITPLTIAFAHVASHNHFVLDRGDRLFKQTSPIIKLPEGAGEDDYYLLLGSLNSSVGCAWLKQVLEARAAGGIGRGLEPEAWMERYNHDATKLAMFPLPDHSRALLPYVRALDACGKVRMSLSVDYVLHSTHWSDAPSLRAALDARRASDLADLHRMVALQEELDWLCYRLYGLLPDDDPRLVPPDDIIPIPPTHLPWALNLAGRDTEIREALSRGEDPGETPTAWFDRHRWTPLLDLPDDAPPALRETTNHRRNLIATIPALGLIETATFKRRWYRPDHDAEEKAALEARIADAVEDAVQSRASTFTLEQVCAVLQDHPRLLAVAEVLTGRRDFSLTELVGQVLATASVPSHPTHVFNEAGLVKRAAWEKTWEDQRREDAGEPVKPEVPPSYGSGDFLRNEYWQLRGKLDVPKERFIAFTEVPRSAAPSSGNSVGPFSADTLFGWAGCPPLQRLKALLSIDEELEDNGIPLADRIGVLDSAWRLLPDVARDDPAAANRLKAELQALVGPEGPSREMLEDWRKRFPPPGASGRRKGRAS